MIRTTLISTAAGLALLVSAPAWGQGPDAFERAVRADTHSSTVSIYPDAFERAAAADKRPSRVSIYPDAFQRALGNRAAAISSPTPGDHHDRLAADATTTSQPVVSSDRALEWSQIGIGFGLGLVLGLGLMLAMRVAGIRPLAH